MKLVPANSVLVLVDIQERLVAAMSDERERVVKNAAILAEAADLLEIPVLVSEQYPRGLGGTVPALAAKLPESARVVKKVEFDACTNDAFRKALGAIGRSQVVLAGMEAHICVYQTARGLAAAGHEVHVPHDATCSRRLDHREQARGLWSAVGATPSITETVLFDWLGKAGGDAFKTISKLIR